MSEKVVLGSKSELGYESLVKELTAVVGEKQCLVDPARTKRYRTGFFYGTGDALAVVIPKTLVEYYRVLKLCCEYDAIVINQAANTGVTGGSTPWGNDYDRPIVIINTLELDGIKIIKEDTDAPQAVCQAGSTLYRLEEKLLKIDREPHSVIGSSCIGASVVGGVCNNSGGTLVQRGPSFTEYACYVRINENREMEFINNLGINLGEGTVEEQLTRLEKGDYSREDVVDVEGKRASSTDYREKVRDVDADTPARYNADPERLVEASGSAGHLGIFAVRVDTFPKPKKQQVFFIGVNNPDELTAIRRALLSEFDGLPIQGEYMSRGCYDAAVKYGKDTFFILNKFGTKHLPKLYAVKDWYDRKFGRKFAFLPSSNSVLQFLSDCLPNLVPDRIVDIRNRYEHMLVLSVGDDMIEPVKKYLHDFFAKEENTGDFIECTPDEGKKAFLVRFAVGGSLVRSMHVFRDSSAGMIALDVALRRNDRQWVEEMEPELREAFIEVNTSGHFLCHVFHRDYLVKKGYDLEEIKEKLLANLRAVGAQYPAEHNVGHLYHAQDTLVTHYKALDPTNTYNPGVGKLSKNKNWAESPSSCGCGHKH